MSNTKIASCPACNKEGESNDMDTELICPYCGHNWSIKLVDTHEEQLALWVKGESTHVKVLLMGNESFECCPDFSCCNPSLKAPYEERRHFAALSEQERTPMLMAFLTKLIDRECPDQKVRIIG